MNTNNHIDMALDCLSQLNSTLQPKISHCSFYKPYHQITSEENIIGQHDILSPMLSQLSFGPSLVQELTTATLELAPYHIDRNAVTALIDSMDFKTGFHTEPINQIKLCYNNILFFKKRQMKLSHKTLESTRCFIRDNGPMMGMLSRNRAEFRVCACTQLLQKNDYSQNRFVNKRLENIKAWLNKQKSGQMESLYRLALEQLHRKRSRDPSMACVRQMLRCDTNRAEMLSTAYALLPKNPFIHTSS